MIQKLQTPDNCDIYYEISELRSNKPALVFINGFTQTMLNWLPFVKFFQNDYQVIRYDARGQGKSEGGDLPLTIDQHVKDLNLLLTVLDIDIPHLVGLSMGAKIALTYAHSHLNQTNKLVLLSFAPDRSVRNRLFMKSLSSLLKHTDTVHMAEVFLPLVFSEDYLAKNTELIPQMVTAVAKRNSKKNLSDQLEILLDEPSSLEMLQKRASPTLILIGEDDPLIDVKRILPFSALPYIDLKLFPETGHSIPAESPQLFVNTISRFLSSDL